MKTLSLVTAFVVLALGLGPALPAVADPPSVPVSASALSGEGDLYQLVAGEVGELVPEDPALSGDSPALALDVIRPDGALERTLVPGSEGPEVEGAPSVVFEDTSQRLYAVWESKKTPTVSRILLADFGADGWSDPIEISGDISPLRDAPRVLMTRDRFALCDAAVETCTRSRTAIHVVWREEGPDGAGFYYTPVILERGRYLGWNPVVALADLDPNPVDSTAVEASDLLRAPELTAGQDVHSAIIGFLSPASGRLITVEIRLFPGEIGFLADDFRGQIIDIGGRSRDDFEAIADKFRGQIIDIGHRLNGGVVRVLAHRAHNALLELYDADPDRPITAIADDFRGQIIDIGVDLLGGPGVVARASKVLEVGASEDGEATGLHSPSVIHLLRVQVVSNLPKPPLHHVPAKIFLSEDGETVLVGWASQGKVYYTESLGEPGPGGEAWTAVKHMTLTERLGVVEAAAILESRVRRQR